MFNIKRNEYNFWNQQICICTILYSRVPPFLISLIMASFSHVTILICIQLLLIVFFILQSHNDTALSKSGIMGIEQAALTSWHYVTDCSSQLVTLSPECSVVCNNLHLTSCDGQRKIIWYQVSLKCHWSLLWNAWEIPRDFREDQNKIVVVLPRGI
jgi:hypothetical protein